MCTIPKWIKLIQILLPSFIFCKLIYSYGILFCGYNFYSLRSMYGSIRLDAWYFCCRLNHHLANSIDKRRQAKLSSHLLTVKSLIKSMWNSKETQHITLFIFNVVSFQSELLLKKSVMIHKSKIIKLYYTTPAIMLMNYTHSSINIQKRNDWEFRICLCLCILMHTKNSKNFLNGFKRQL